MDKKLLYTIVGSVAAMLIVNKITEPWRAEQKAKEEELLQKTDEMIDGWMKDYESAVMKREPITVRLKIDSPLRKHYTEI